MDKIIINGLRLFARHGVLAEEKENGQYFFIDLLLDVDLSAAEKSDLLDDTVNYDEICRVVRDVFTARSFDLIERAAGEIIDAVFREFPPVQAVDLTLKKPEAPLCCEVNYAAVRLRRER